jgi:tRNA pseudouridine32 synthase/23S rRNA pseudouridine746 synthase/23S rRNA pseudouridine1911/1915/1917 synthase
MSKHPKPKANRFLRGITILYEDRDIIVINKPAGLLTMGKRGEKLPNAQGILTNYLRKGNARSRIPLHIVHRLDRETSGVLIFAKSRHGQDTLKKNWSEVKKIYLAVVYGQFDKKQGTITSYLAENKDQFVASTENQKQGKLSRTAYKVVKATKRYSLLEINLLTGRKNQIRVHMAEAGHPVVGDRKYGRKGKKTQRMALHAKSIAFQHPHTNQRLFFETETPAIFEALTRQSDESAALSNRKKYAEKNNASAPQQAPRRNRR